MTDQQNHKLKAMSSPRLHWPEYVMDFTEVGLYLFFTCIFATLLQHPASPIQHLLPNGIAGRAAFGISVGATIVAIVLTPWANNPGAISIQR